MLLKDGFQVRKRFKEFLNQRLDLYPGTKITVHITKPYEKEIQVNI